jgi:hypothetical protein
MMARRAALQSELSRCEAELGMLGMEKDQVQHSGFGNNVLRNLSWFAARMEKISELSTNVYATIVLRMWGALFYSLSDLAGRAPHELSNYSDTNAHSIANKINQSIDRVRECMNMLRMAFKDIDSSVCELCMNAVHGLYFDEEASPDGKYIVKTKYTIESNEEYLAYVSSIAEKMCHTIRLLHCSNDTFYMFLGTEEAKNLMISSFSILDPGRGDPPDAIKPNPSDGDGDDAKK